MSLAKPTSRRAFTLIELLIVLLIMVMILSITWPSVDRMQRKSRMRSAARLMRSELADARLAAIKSGVPYVFRFQPGTGIYEIGPRVNTENAAGLAGSIAAANEAVAQDTAAGAVAVGPDGITPAMTDDAMQTIENGRDNRPDETGRRKVAASSDGTVQKELAGGVRFLANRIASETRDTESLENQFGTDNARINEVIAQAVATTGHPLDRQATTQWSEAILFFPNGRTSSATLRLATDAEPFYQVDITLRGLTGASHINPVRRIGL